MWEQVLLGHGAGGKLSQELIKEIILPILGNDALAGLNDSAIFRINNMENSKHFAFTTDSFVVKPLFFPGGDIGRLSVYGTVNDLAMVGAKPLCLSLSFIIEEGLSRDTLVQVINSIDHACNEAKVKIVTGDTKVVERGAADELYITTSGVGVIPEGANVSGSGAQVGDSILLNGYIGDHEIAVALARGDFSLRGEVKSDCAPLCDLVEAILNVCPDVHCMRDPTRGGLATVLNEIAIASEVGILVNQEKIFVRKEVIGVCDILGYDPFYLANEGKVVVFVPKDYEEVVLEAMKAHPLGEHATVIGSVVAEHPGTVLLRTHIGGHRVLRFLTGEQLPRIC